MGQADNAYDADEEKVKADAAAPSSSKRSSRKKAAVTPGVTSQHYSLAGTVRAIACRKPRRGRTALNLYNIGFAIPEEQATTLTHLLNSGCHNWH